MPPHVQCPTHHPEVPAENLLTAGRRGADHALAEGFDPSAAERVAGLSTSDHHHVADSCRGTCTDLARTLLLPSAPPASAASTSFAPGSAAPHRCVFLWLAIDPRTRASVRAPAGSPHATHGPCGDSLPATDAGPRLSSALDEGRLTSLLLCAHRPLCTLAPGELARPKSPPVASGSGPDLRPGEKC